MTLPINYQDATTPTGALTELPATTGRGINAITTQINTNTTDIADLQSGIYPRTTTIASSATPTFDVTQCELLNITALAVAVTSMTSGMTGTPVNGQTLVVRFKDNGTTRAITWGANYVSSGTATLLAATSANKTHHVSLMWDGAIGKFVCLGVDVTGY